MFRLGTRRIRDIWRRKDGATAVEFAIIAIPFFWIVFGIAEFAGIALIQTSLDAAVAETARTVRTGEAQSGGVTAGAMKDSICNQLTLAVDCEGALYLDVRRFADFDSVTNPNPVQGGAVDPSQMGFQPGAASEVVLVRSYYNWKLLTPFFADVFSNVGSGQYLVVSSALFRNEPF